MSDQKYTLEDRLLHANERLSAALESVERAGALYATAHEMGGGIPGFGGSGNQRAARQVSGALDRAFRAQSEADQRVKFWTQKVRSYERRIAERDRVRLTRDDVTGASWVRTSSGWRKVARVNAKTVSVETGYSWVDRIDFDQILEVRKT